MFKFIRDNRPVPNSKELDEALECLAEATRSPVMACQLHDRIMDGRDDDEGLAALVFTVINGLDDRRTTPKDRALKKLVCMAGLSGEDLVNHIKNELR